MLDINAIIQTIAIVALPVIFAITLHEAAHGYAARHFGDPTAWAAGAHHAQPDQAHRSDRHHPGSGGHPAVLRRGLPVRLCQAGAGGFRAPAHPKRDMLWVALAGPGANLFMAFCLGADAQALLGMPDFFSLPLARDGRGRHHCTQNVSSPACARPAPAPRPLPRRAEELGQAAARVPCLFFVADWHALTTHYDTPQVIEKNAWDMVIDWLAAGVDPDQATLFIQSRCPSMPNCTCCCR
jgi:hypothetical protein